jgi:hypothetical protein
VAATGLDEREVMTAGHEGVRRSGHRLEAHEVAAGRREHLGEAVAAQECERSLGVSPAEHEARRLHELGEAVVPGGLAELAQP